MVVPNSVKASCTAYLVSWHAQALYPGKIRWGQILERHLLQRHTFIWLTAIRRRGCSITRVSSPTCSSRFSAWSSS